MKPVHKTCTHGPYRGECGSDRDEENGHSSEKYLHFLCLGISYPSFSTKLCIIEVCALIMCISTSMSMEGCMHCYKHVCMNVLCIHSRPIAGGGGGGGMGWGDWSIPPPPPVQCSSYCTSIFFCIRLEGDSALAFSIKQWQPSALSYLANCTGTPLPAFVFS